MVLVTRKLAPAVLGTRPTKVDQSITSDRYDTLRHKLGDPETIFRTFNQRRVWSTWSNLGNASLWHSYPGEMLHALGYALSLPTTKDGSARLISQAAIDVLRSDSKEGRAKKIGTLRELHSPAGALCVMKRELGSAVTVELLIERAKEVSRDFTSLTQAIALTYDLQLINEITQGSVPPEMLSKFIRETDELCSSPSYRPFIEDFPPLVAQVFMEMGDWLSKMGYTWVAVEAYNNAGDYYLSDSYTGPQAKELAQKAYSNAIALADDSLDLVESNVWQTAMLIRDLENLVAEIKDGDPTSYDQAVALIEQLLQVDSDFQPPDRLRVFRLAYDLYTHKSMVVGEPGNAVFMEMAADVLKAKAEFLMMLGATHKEKGDALAESNRTQAIIEYTAAERLFTTAQKVYASAADHYDAIEDADEKQQDALGLAEVAQNSASACHSNHSRLELQNSADHHLN